MARLVSFRVYYSALPEQKIVEIFYCSFTVRMAWCKQTVFYLYYIRIVVKFIRNYMLYPGRHFPRFHGVCAKSRKQGAIVSEVDVKSFTVEQENANTKKES